MYYFNPERKRISYSHFSIEPKDEFKAKIIFFLTQILFNSNFRQPEQDPLPISSD